MTALAVTSLPEFVVAIGLIILRRRSSRICCPRSRSPPGTYAWAQPRLLILPVATLVIVVVPYIFRMMRAAMIEALESDYVEMARLKGVPEWQIVLAACAAERDRPDHPGDRAELPVPGRRRCGGRVRVRLPGIGQGLVCAVQDRDIPVIQFIVVVLAAFYVVINIVTDVIALVATPRRRIAR